MSEVFDFNTKPSVLEVPRFISATEIKNYLKDNGIKDSITLNYIAKEYGDKKIYRINKFFSDLLMYVKNNKPFVYSYVRTNSYTKAKNEEYKHFPKKNKPLNTNILPPLNLDSSYSWNWNNANFSNNREKNFYTKKKTSHDNFLLNQISSENPLLNPKTQIELEKLKDDTNQPVIKELKKEIKWNDFVAGALPWDIETTSLLMKQEMPVIDSHNQRIQDRVIFWGEVIMKNREKKLTLRPQSSWDKTHAFVPDFGYNHNDGYTYNDNYSYNDNNYNYNENVVWREQKQRHKINPLYIQVSSDDLANVPISENNYNEPKAHKSIQTSNSGQSVYIDGKTHVIPHSWKLVVKGKNWWLVNIQMR